MQESTEKAPQITLVEWFDEHWYKIERENGAADYFPSVTTKLGIVAKPFLATWRGDIGNREANLRLFEAQERGTRIHHAWYTLTTDGAVIYQNWKRPIYTDQQLDDLKLQYNGNVAIMAYQDEMLDVWKLSKFLEVVKPKVIASELTVYSDRYQEAGTVDNVLEIAEGDYQVNGKSPLHLPGGIYIADLKTGNVFDENAYMQTASYANMFTEMRGVPVVGTLGIHTNSKNRTGIEGLGVYYRNQAEMHEDFQDFRHVSDMWSRKNKQAKPRLFEFPALLTLRKETQNA
ncbi:MAG TPA: hypothetical protein VD994_03530 [Prosthecobacter sp.]|nr:hypothetical protein [Prosthecobacter sp.]